MTKDILLIGCGNMGYALLKGWLESAAPPAVHVVEPTEALRDRAAAAGALAVADASALPDALAPELAVLAVKPQVMAEVVPAYRRFAGGATTFVSVAAGVTIASLERHLPGPTPVIRTMPNTPASIGAGMFVSCANGHAAAGTRELLDRLLGACGVTAWIDDEALMDAVTAISGSGPAYVFHFIEALAEAGAALGIAPELSRTLATQTVMGAGKLAAASREPAETLRRQVTSPGGTTAAALAVLMDEDALKRLVAAAALAARDRGIELGQE